MLYRLGVNPTPAHSSPHGAVGRIAMQSGTYLAAWLAVSALFNRERLVTGGGYGRPHG